MEFGSEDYIRRYVTRSSETSNGSVDFRHVLSVKISSKKTLNFFLCNYWWIVVNNQASWRQLSLLVPKKLTMCQRCYTRGVHSRWLNCQPLVLLGVFEKMEGERPDEKGRSMPQRVLPTWQCTGVHRNLCKAVFDRKYHDTDHPLSLLTWSSLLWLISGPQTQIEHEMKAFWHCAGD